MRFCYLARFGRMENDEEMPACYGRLRKCHIIPAQLLKREGADPWDDRAWVWACGGLTGIGGHHGALDHSRRLRLPRSAVPPQTEELAAELGLGWWLDRAYGEQVRV